MIFACSDFLFNNSGSNMVSARTMDFAFPLEAEVVEKMQIYDNPYHVLTNDPPFPGQIKNLAKYKKLTNTG